MNGRGDTIMPDQHLGENAELYALGALDAAEAERVDAHAARCAACAALLAGAERTVATMVEATVPDAAPPPELAERIAAIGRVTPLRRKPAPLAQRFSRWGALAASLLIVIGGAAGTRTVLHMRDIVVQDNMALAVVANSHFKHATLTKADPSAPTSKVLWGLSRHWVYVIVASPDCACRVVAITAAGERDLGPPLERGTTAALFANDLPPVRRIELQRDGRITESATTP